MSKVIRCKADDQTEFVKAMRSIEGKYPLWQIWQDFIYLTAIMLSNAIDKVHAAPREEMYLNIIGKYSKKEQEVFPKLIALVVTALERDKNRDFLGELYMTMELGNHWKGQFFTPYDVCVMMARMNGGNAVAELSDKGYITVNDCACGAGALLIAYANTVEIELKDTNYNWQNHILFTAQDVDMVAGLVCYIQLSLIGCAGYIKIGNTLTDPMSSGEAEANLHIEKSPYWYTPMYFSDAWRWRRLFRSMDAMMSRAEETEAKEEEKAEKVEEKKTIAQNEPKVEQTELVIESNGQLALF